MVFFMIEFLNSQFGIALRHFIGFVLEVGSEIFVYDLSSVFGTDENMIIAEVDGMGIVYVVHAAILSRGAEEEASASIPRAYARGFTCAVKKCQKQINAHSPRRNIRSPHKKYTLYWLVLHSPYLTSKSVAQLPAGVSRWKNSHPNPH